MSKTSTIESVRAFARMFQSVIDLAEQVEPIAKLELAEAELRGQVGKLQAERDALAASVTEASDTAKRLVEEAKAQAAATVNAAIEQANAEAVRIVAAAKEQAAGVNDDAKAEADKLAKRVAKLKAEESDLDRDVDAKKAQAADLEARIAAAQEKARKMIEG